MSHKCLIRSYGGWLICPFLVPFRGQHIAHAASSPLPDQGTLLHQVVQVTGGCLPGGASSLLIEGIGKVRLKAKGFASTNCVYGVGSFTYQFNTRDTFGMAVKATYGVVNGEPLEVFKDPVTDDGMKKSAKGLIRVDGTNGNYTYTDCVTPEEEQKGELRPVFCDGKLLIDEKLSDVRARVLA